MRQWYFQGIDVDPVMNPSLNSIKGSLYLKSKGRDTNEKART